MIKKVKEYFIALLLMGLIFPMVTNAASFPFPSFGGGGPNIDAFRELLIPGHHLTKALMRAIMQDMTEELGIDRDIFRRGVRKSDAPTVDITFDITNPKEGEKVTAMAVPKFFRNSLEDLYYTWYIIHTDSKGRVKGDLNKAIEEGKKEAMGYVVRGSFDPTLQGIKYEGKDKDNDGFKANVGGKDGVGAKKAGNGKCSGGACPNKVGKGTGCLGCYDDQGAVLQDWKKKDGILTKQLVVKSKKISRCYLRNFGLKFREDSKKDYSGRDLIVECKHKFARCGNYVTGDGKFGMGEEKCWKTNPESSDTDGDGVVDEADVAGLGQNQLTWRYKKGDRVGVIVEGTSVNAINEGTASHREYKPLSTKKLIEGRAKCKKEYIERLKSKNCYFHNATPMINAGGGTISGGDGTITFKDKEYNEHTYGMELCRAEAKEEYSKCLKNLRGRKEKKTKPKGEMTGYYKITWAMPDFCDKEVKDKGKVGADGLTPNDGCDSKKDLGFPFAATIPVSEEGRKPLEVTVDHAPKNPQFNIDNNDFSTLITAQASVSDKEVNQDFLYYKWRVVRCKSSDFGKCSEGKGGKDVTDLIKNETPLEGLGVKELKFYPTAELFSNGVASKEMLKVSALVKRRKGDAMTGMANTFITLTKNNLKIRIFQMEEQGGRWVKGKEICTENPSLTVCPVYPYQVLAVTAEANGGNLPAIESYQWKKNDKAILPPHFSGESCRNLFGEGLGVKFCHGNEERSGFAKTVYFPVNGKEGDNIKLSVLAERRGTKKGDRDDDLISQRLLQVVYPTAKFKFDSDNIKQAGNFYGEGSPDVFEAPAKEKINVHLILRPDYLEKGNDLKIVWQQNEQVLPESIDKSEAVISLPKEVGSLTSLGVRTEKVFSPEYFKLLASTWNIFNESSLIKKTVLKIKTLEPIASNSGEENASIKQFFASTWYNAPHYLIFTVRLALILVLAWGIIFGLAYSVKMI